METKNQNLGSGIELTLIECSPAGIAATDAGGWITTWNRAAEKITGCLRKDVIGRRSPIPFEDGPDRERRFLRADGQEIEISCAVSSMPADGGFAGKIAIFEDVTERKRAQRLAESRQKMESLGVFAGGVAHDFNNLLTGILGNAGLGIYCSDEGSEVRSCFQEVIRAAERAGALTRQLLAYAGKGRFVAAKLSLSDLVRDIVPVAKSSMVNKSIRVRFDLEPQMPLIEGDPGQLQQVILSLIVNSAEAIDGRVGSIKVATRTETVSDGRHAPGGEPVWPGRYAVVEIADSGAGMDEATLARIFEPFFSTKFTGRGLGLSAALGIVRQHRGSITVHSVPGQGSTFRVHLPLVEERSAKNLQSLEMSGLHGAGLVLVADDEESVRNTVQRSLQRWGYEVILAENGQAAVELLSLFSHQIRAAVLDVLMPVMGGEEALTHLRPRYPDLPVILMSGYRQESLPRRNSGRNVGFLQKPFTAEQLGRQLSDLLDQEVRRDGRASEFDRERESVGDR